METPPVTTGAGIAPAVQCRKRPGHTRGCGLTRAIAALLLGALLPLSTAAAFRGGSGGTPTPAVSSGGPGPVTATWVVSSPAHPGLIYAGGYLGTPVLCVRERMVGCTLWAARSTDAGTRWTPLHPDDTYVPRPYQLGGYQDPGMPPPPGVLYRSADSGRSWQRVTPEISPPISPAPPQ